MLATVLKPKAMLLGMLLISCASWSVCQKATVDSIISNEKKLTKIDTVKDGSYKLIISTVYTNDTLNVVDYKEDKYSSPVVLSQSLSFLKNDKVLTQINIPIKRVKKITSTGKYLWTLQTPIYQANIVKMKQYGQGYLISGSDYCNGSDCKEFIGVYTMDGKIQYQGFTGDKRSKLGQVISEQQIEMNTPIKSFKVADFW